MDNAGICETVDFPGIGVTVTVAANLTQAVTTNSLTANVGVTSTPRRGINWSSPPRHYDRLDSASGCSRGTVDEGTANAVDTYINTLVTNSLWTKMSTNSIIMLYATDGFAGLFEPLVRPSGVTPVNHNFVSGDYSLSTGLNPGSGNTTKYVDLGYNSYTWLTEGSGQVSVYCRTDADGADGGSIYPIEIAGSTATYNRLGLSVRLSGYSNNTVFDSWMTNSGSRVIENFL